MAKMRIVKSSNKIDIPLVVADEDGLCVVVGAEDGLGGDGVMFVIFTIQFE